LNPTIDDVRNGSLSTDAAQPRDVGYGFGSGDAERLRL